MTTLITGVAGFIGMQCSLSLLKEGKEVVGVDNINDYYDQTLKLARLKLLKKYPNFIFKKISIENFHQLNKLFKKVKPNIVLHLAAQAGVRYSLKNPFAYIESNVNGFMSILECCKIYNIHHLIYASSSSVYGGNTKLPYSEDDNVDKPINIYAATKKSNELMAHSYSHLYNLPTTGLRFFTVYGPWGRPDMALYKFTEAIYKNKKINVFNNGNMLRDFTYIDDVVECIKKILAKSPLTSISKKGKSKSDIFKVPYKIFNIGNNKPENLNKYISAIEISLNKTAKINLCPMQPGDIQKTHSDTSLIYDWINFKPSTDIKNGVKNFVSWYLNYHHKSG